MDSSEQKDLHTDPPNPTYPARLWRPYGDVENGESNKMVQCLLCSHFCRIADGKNGLCGVRINDGGTLKSMVARSVSALNLDPVEKKPLFHFLPGSSIFSVGSIGCNFHCSFCQNSNISQIEETKQLSGVKAGMHRLLRTVTPAALVKSALASGAKSIAYTYNEPTMFFELLQDCAKVAKDSDLRNVLVSNAYMSKDCFNELNGLIDAANFDLKSFSNDFYKKVCGARLEPVLETIKSTVKAGWWVELTTLLIPGYNDSEEELHDIANFIANELGTHVPWHVSRFHPAYKMIDVAQTPISSIERALAAGNAAGLKFVYSGNIPGHSAENTTCPSCGEVVIERKGYDIQAGISRTFDGHCIHCKELLPGIWE